jgi:energy-converting hydrogenase Eha subunit C
MTDKHNPLDKITMTLVMKLIAYLGVLVTAVITAVFQFGYLPTLERLRTTTPCAPVIRRVELSEKS